MSILTTLSFVAALSATAGAFPPAAAGSGASLGPDRAPAATFGTRGPAAARPDVICPRILAHQRFKALAATRPPDERARMYANMGLAFEGPEPGDPDSESVAVHVLGRLSEVEIDALSAEGLLLNRGLFVPAVPGRHPHGFHLGRMDYAAMDRVRQDPRIVRVTSTEMAVEPLNDISLEFINAAPVHAGEGVGPFLGTGVLVAVGDSGVDLTHPDLPTPVVAYDVTTGEWEPDWSTDVANTVIFHGTHVTGTVLGSGLLSGGKYRGGAPAADLAAYKLGNNINGSSTWANMIKCVTHAASIGADIYTVSYGGYDNFLDGSSTIAQAFDAAFEAGTVCFASAGNSAQNRRHYSAQVSPGGVSGTFVLRLSNPEGAAYTLPIVLNVIWRDAEIHDDWNVSLECLSLGEDESLEQGFAIVSPRNTESKSYILLPNVPAQSTKEYQLRLANSAVEGPAPLVHVYQISTSQAIFPVADSSYTVLTPAEADTVLAVGAWVHRKNWVDWTGANRSSTQTLDTLASFSSLGPRIDGVLKPDIVAPGSMTISLRDSQFANNSSRIIDNDGINDGLGPANYYTAQGTSMAAPIAAGGTALVREAFPALTAGQLRARITSTASAAASPDNSVGHGMIDILAALSIAPADLDGNGIVDGADLGLLLSAWGECPGCPADLTGDGMVDGADLGQMLSAWR